MKIEGGCYCKAVRYEATGEPLVKAQCHCRECQYISGGHPNVVMGMPEAGFKYTTGAPKQFTRKDIEGPATRDFCAECGTHLLTRSPKMPGVMLVKVGTLDDPGLFGMPQLAIHLADAAAFHQRPEGAAHFQRMPG